VRPLLGILLISLLPQGAPAQKKAVIMGIVADTTKTPLVDAQVTAVKAKVTIRTDRRGIFILDQLPPGEELFWVRRIGYRPETFDVTLVAGDTVKVGIILAAAPVMLPELSVEAEGRVYTGKLTGFAQRMLHSGAARTSFLTRADIEKQFPAQFIDMLVGAGMKRTRDRRGKDTLTCPRGVTSPSRAPRVAFYLDGALIADGGSMGAVDPIMIESIIRMEPVLIEAVEVYRSTATRPAEFNASGAGCVVVIWTR
jgi:hypothetical protein